jgi:hypothetical protein
MNYLYAPSYFDWTTDGSGELNFFVDDFIVSHNNVQNDKPHIAMLIEPRTIQPTIYKYLEDHYKEFDLIFTHDENILDYENAKPIIFMNWYKTYDVPKTKYISMVCSDKIMCDEHKQRQLLALALAGKVDHYGTFMTNKRCDYYECRAEYMFEVVVDNNWSGYWISEKIANPLASKTIPIYLGSKHIGEYINPNGVIVASNIEEIPNIVNRILINPEKEYMTRINAVNENYKIVQNYRIFEDYLYITYKDTLEALIK